MSDVEFLIKLRDAAALVLDACQEKLEKIVPKETKQEMPPDLGAIVWKPTIGPKGPFEIAESKANANNASFAGLTAYLNGHEGKATVSGYFLWKFTDGSGSIGRKQKEP